MARLWLNAPPKTGYGSVLIEIELGATDKATKARLVAAGHTYEVKASAGRRFAWVPLPVAEAQTNIHLEVELDWVRGTFIPIHAADQDKCTPHHGSDQREG